MSSLAKGVRATVLLLLAVGLGSWFFPPSALAKIELPALASHVVDPDKQLTSEEQSAIEQRLDHARRQHGFTIVALVVASLDGEPIEDLAYRAFNLWGIGDQERDDGVLLVIAVDEKRSRIETGRGIGGDLTDLESAEILRAAVQPQLTAGHVGAAVDAGTLAIEEHLGTLPPTDLEQGTPKRGFPWAWLLLIPVVALAVVSRTARQALFWILASLSFGGGGRGRGGFGGGGGGSSGGGGANG